MQIYKPLARLPADIQLDWQASLHPATPTERGAFRLVAARRTKPKTFEEQRVIVLAVDENGFPMPNVRVAFAYSTADPYTISPDFQWSPPPPQRAFVVPTQGSGQIDQIQGSVVKAGEPGGITVYILEPEYSSDVVAGAGTLADHSGLHLTFQLLRVGVTPLPEWLARIETDIATLREESAHKKLDDIEQRLAAIGRKVALLEGIVNAR